MERCVEGVAIILSRSFAKEEEDFASAIAPDSITIYNYLLMKKSALLAAILIVCLTACNKSTPSSGSPASPAKSPDAVEIKLQEYAGSSATDCGRLDVHAPEAQSKSASDCAMQASQGKRPFYVTYDMPGMTVGVAGNAEGKLFTVQAQGSPSPSVTSGPCPSELRVASSGRITCYAPGDMGSLGSGHTAIPPGMPNPHSFPKSK